MSKKITLLVLIVLVLMVLAIPASAQDSSAPPCPVNTWSGAADTNWSNGGNWSCGSAPLFQSVVIPASATPNFPIVPSATSVFLNDLDVQAGASFDLNGNFLLVTGVFTNSGTLIDRRTISDLVLFPTCFFCAGGYAGLLLHRDTAGVNNPGVVEVIIKGNQGSCDNDNSSIGRCFNITPANITNVSIDAIFPFDPATELNGLTCEQLDVYHWNGSSWLAAGNHLVNDCETNTTPYYAIVTENITSFSPFAVGAGAPTAVSLVGVDTHAPMQPVILGAAAFGLLALIAGGILLNRKHNIG